MIICLIMNAKPIKIGDLVANGKEYDGKIVYIEAEVIGDVMLRGEKAWVNVNDGTGAMGIYMDAEDTKDIQYTGKYKTLGDQVNIKGVFHHAFNTQNGDMGIEVQSFEVIAEGKEVSNSIATYNTIVIGMLVPITIVLYGIQIYKRHHL